MSKTLTEVIDDIEGIREDLLTLQRSLEKMESMPNESHSEQLRRESDELLATAAKLIEHADTLKNRRLNCGSR
jgi:hypothetical protein